MKNKPYKKPTLDEIASYMNRRELGEDVSDVDIDTIGEFIEHKLDEEIEDERF